MIRIEKPSLSDVKKLAELAEITFVQSHGHSASESDITNYLLEHYTEAAFNAELANPDYWYYVIYYNQKLVGYSKIVLNYSAEVIPNKNVAKLERIYVLEEVHGLGVGKALFEENIKLAKAHLQAGIWLFTWVENLKAIQFYKKMGFKIIGKYDFRISDTHTNPNHQFYLKF